MVLVGCKLLDSDAWKGVHQAAADGEEEVEQSVAMVLVVDKTKY